MGRQVGKTPLEQPVISEEKSEVGSVRYERFKEGVREDASGAACIH